MSVQQGTIANTESLLPKQDGPAPAETKSTFFETFQVLFMITIWYALNLGYNVYNKKTLNLIDAPWTLSTMQLCTGLFIFGPLWAFRMRTPPNVSMQTLLAMFPLGVFHALTHLAAVVALGAGHVSMFQILKSAEPLFTCFFGGVIMRQVFPWYVYVTILPIMFGVAYSAMGGHGDGGVNMLSFTGAMMSNLGSSLRAIYSKVFMNKRKENMAANPDAPSDELTPANMYALITIWAILVSFPFAVWFEISELAASWSDAKETHEVSSQAITLSAMSSGVFYYVYNEVAFVTLNKVNAVTHSIANTFKRIILIIVTAIIFSEVFTAQKIIGSIVAIVGVFLYSLAKNKAAGKI